MTDLSTTYLGLKLRNPLIVGASPLTVDAAAVARCEQAGAGAVVLKSLFEEQIRTETSALGQSLEQSEDWHSEVFGYMEANIGMRYGSREYLDILRACKAAVSIPVMASINCISTEWWEDFARETEAAGADALELNLSIMPTTLGTPATEIEDQYIEVVRLARRAVSIPLAVKLGPQVTSISHLVLRLRQAGANGFVLFNRFYRPTIDIESMSLVVDRSHSTSSELATALRWTSILADRIGADLAATNGVHTSEDAIRMLLAGSSAVQMVSALYENGLEHVQHVLDGITHWMQRRRFASIADFRGRMSQAAQPENDLFTRVQYIKGLVGVD